MSSAFYPQGMNSYNNRSSEQSYQPWKGDNEFVNPIGITSGNIRPFTNNDPTNTSNPGFGLPRPIKHYRRGITMNNENSRQVKSSTKGLMITQVMDNPGGVIIKSNSTPEYTCENFNGLEIVSNWAPIQNLTEKPQPGQVSCDINNKPIGNQETKARNRSRFATTILKKNYFVTDGDLLYNRCLTFDQCAFNFKSTNETSPNTYLANCSSSALDECKREVIYKPSNTKFSSQGAVSSSTRILDLQRATIAKGKNSFVPKINVCNPKNNRKKY